MTLKKDEIIPTLRPIFADLFAGALHEPLYHVLDQTISGRKDKIKKGLEFSELLENAPDYKDKLFKVPPVIIGKKQSK